MATNIGVGSGLRAIKSGSVKLTDDDITKNMAAIDSNLKSIWSLLVDCNKRIAIIEQKVLN